jgi:hypothetical protein
MNKRKNNHEDLVDLKTEREPLLYHLGNLQKRPGTELEGTQTVTRVEEPTIKNLRRRCLKADSWEGQEPDQIQQDIGRGLAWGAHAG